MLNKVVLMGRLTADPELRRTQSGIAVTGFALAVERGFTKAGEQKQTDFIECVAWQHTAEFAAKWFRKGMLVAVAGRLQVRDWEDKQGQKRRSYEVVVEEAHFAEAKKGGQESQPVGPFEMEGLEDLDEEDGSLPF